MAKITRKCTIAGYGSFVLTAFSGGQKRRIGGKTSIDPIVLTTLVSGRQKYLGRIAHKVANQKQNAKFAVTIVETRYGKKLRTLSFGDCLFTSLDFPTCVAGSGALLTETVTFKPTLLNVT